MMKIRVSNKKYNYYVSYIVKHEKGSEYGGIALKGNKKLSLSDLLDFKGVIFEKVYENSDLIVEKMVILSIYRLK